MHHVRTWDRCLIVEEAHGVCRCVHDPDVGRAGEHAVGDVSDGDVVRVGDHIEYGRVLLVKGCPVVIEGEQDLVLDLGRRVGEELLVALA